MSDDRLPGNFHALCAGQLRCRQSGTSISIGMRSHAVQYKFRFCQFSIDIYVTGLYADRLAEAQQLTDACRRLLACWFTPCAGASLNDWFIRNCPTAIRQFSTL